MLIESGYFHIEENLEITIADLEMLLYLIIIKATEKSIARIENIISMELGPSSDIFEELGANIGQEAFIKLKTELEQLKSEIELLVIENRTSNPGMIEALMKAIIEKNPTFFVAPPSSASPKLVAGEIANKVAQVLDGEDNEDIRMTIDYFIGFGIFLEKGLLDKIGFEDIPPDRITENFNVRIREIKALFFNIIVEFSANFIMYLDGSSEAPNNKIALLAREEAYAFIQRTEKNFISQGMPTRSAAEIRQARNFFNERLNTEFKPHLDDYLLSRGIDKASIEFLFDLLKKGI